jgi:uncharacterized membrane protein
MDSGMHYLPLTPGLFSILILLFAGLIILIQLRILRYAHMRLGVGPGAALLLLFGSLIGSYFNIPITVLPGQPVTSRRSWPRQSLLSSYLANTRRRSPTSAARWGH